MKLGSGMRQNSRKQASIQQLLVRGAQRRAEQQITKGKVRKALVEVKTKYSKEMKS